MVTLADRATYLQAVQTVGRFHRPRFKEVQDLVEDLCLLARQIERANSFTLAEAQQLLDPLHLDEEGHMLAPISSEEEDPAGGVNLNDRGEPTSIDPVAIDHVLGELGHLFPLDEMTMMELGTAFESEEYIELWPENIGPWCWEDEVFCEYLDEPRLFEDSVRLEVFSWALFEANPSAWARLDERFGWNVEYPEWGQGLHLDCELFEFRMRQAGLGTLLVINRFAGYDTGCLFFDFNPYYYNEFGGTELPVLSAQNVVKLVRQWKDGLRLLLARQQAYQLVRRNPGALQQWVDILHSCLSSKSPQKGERS